MSFRTASLASLMLMTSVAAADDRELAITPSCAEVDADRDTLAEPARAEARDQLVRVMQDLDLLVVDAGCVDRYVLSHYREGDDFLVRVAGPAGSRRVRNPKHALPEVYERLVSALLEAQAEAARASDPPAEAAESFETTRTAAVEEHAVEHNDNDEDVAPAEATPAVRDDLVLYAQLLLGNYGTGLGFGLRIPVTRSVAIDLSLEHANADQRELVAFGVKLLSFRRPDASASPYFGFGMSGGAQSDDYMNEGSGARFDGVVGYMFNRTGSTRGFLQAGLSIPTYEAPPTLMIALGAGR